ncbi:MAG: hypothetical protein R3B09_25415 [Nannocystaceae bacterium]
MTSAPRRRAAAAATLLLAGALACATYSDRTQAARDAAQAGNLEGGERAINKALGLHKSEELPTKWKSETGLGLLERAMILHALGHYKLSSRDLTAAEKQLELLDIARDGAGTLGKYVFSDASTKYKTPPTEKLALNAYNMLNYLALGDLDGAKVEARRFTVIRRYYADHDPENAHGAFGSYLAGYVFERLGDEGEALRYYEEALQERTFDQLRAPIARMHARAGVEGPRIRALLAEGTGSAGGPEGGSAAAPAPAPEAELLVVLNVGRVPYKVPKRIPIGAAVGLGAAYITGDTTVLEHSLFKVVVYPDLAESGDLFDHGRLAVDGQSYPLELVTDMGVEIAREYDELRPKIIGAAISRLIVRAVAAEGARAAGKQSKNNSGLVGFLAAAAVEGAMVAADKPDTRSWTMLPARVYVARIPLAPGHHVVTLDAAGPGGREGRKAEVDIPAGGFAVLDVTTLR